MFYRFEVHLYKQDGWFDTHIPITAGQELLLWNPQIAGSNAWIKAMIEQAVIYPPLQLNGPQSRALAIVALLPEDTPANTSYCKALQCMDIPPGDVKSLKLKVFPDSAPDDVTYSVKVFDSDPSKAEPERFAQSKQREQNALAEWDRK
jgi:hypothetical protein